MCIRDSGNIRRWYDGYRLSGLHIYNPFAVTNLILQGNFQSYWLQSGTYESVKDLISIDFDGLRKDVIELLAGGSVKVNPYFFQNDMDSFDDKNDVLALLIHLGYLAYSPEKETAEIPNEEIRTEVQKAVQSVKWTEILDFLKAVSYTHLVYHSVFHEVIQCRLRFILLYRQYACDISKRNKTSCTSSFEPVSYTHLARRQLVHTVILHGVHVMPDGVVTHIGAQLFQNFLAAAHGNQHHDVGVFLGYEFHAQRNIAAVLHVLGLVRNVYSAQTLCQVTAKALFGGHVEACLLYTSRCV